MSNIKVISKAFLSSLTEQQIKTIENYKSQVKLRSVLRWRERMSKNNISRSQISEVIGVSPTRISEYVNFKHEPKESKFNLIENTLYNLEK